MTPVATACVMLFLCATYLTTGIDAQIAAVDQQTIVDQINSRRSALAKGTLKGSGCPMSATNSMLKMVWNASLANAAQSWSDKCVFEHSAQNDRNAGENLYAGATSEPDPVSVSSAVIEGVNDWWGELDNWPCNNVFTSTSNSAGDVGHFTQLAWANTWQVGCGYTACGGAMEFGPDFTNDYFLVCRFLDQGNIKNQPVYTSSAACTAGTKCSASKTHPTATCGTDGLCTV